MAIISALPFTIANGQPYDAVPVQSNFLAILNDVNTNAAPLAGPTFSGTATFNGPAIFNGLQTNPGATQTAFAYYLNVLDTTGLSGTNIVFAASQFTQQGTDYNAATGVMTATTAGLYLFSAGITTSNNTGATVLRTAQVAKNGSVYQNASFTVDNLAFADLRFSGLVRLAATDTLSVQPLWNRTVQSPVIASQSTYFHCYLLG